MSTLSKWSRASRLHYRLTGISGVFHLITGTLTRNPRLIEIKRPDLMFPLFMRIPSTDILIYQQILSKKYYHFDISRTPDVIVDAVANIGLTSIYFANRFPHWTIIAIEPEDSNYKTLICNTEKYTNIIPICAALWHTDTPLGVVNIGGGQCGYITQTPVERNNLCGAILHDTRGITLNALMHVSGEKRRLHDQGRFCRPAENLKTGGAFPLASSPPCCREVFPL